MSAIDPGELATQCVQSGIFCGVTPHYLMMAAKYLRPDLTDDEINGIFGPFGFKQDVWDANCKNGDFDLDYDTTDISDWTMQCTVFASIARAELNKLQLNADGTSPTALALFKAQMNAMMTPVPDGSDAQLTTDLDKALTDTRQDILTAAANVLDPTSAQSSTVASTDSPASGSTPSSPAGFGPMDDVAWPKYCNVLGARESSNNYASVNQINFCGRWQFGAGALCDGGYVKPGKKNSDLPTPSSWTGKDGVNSLNDWLSNHSAQDSAMAEYTKGHYNQLVHNGSLPAGSSLPRVAGLLAAAHLLGVGGATNFVNGDNSGADANGVTAGVYYKLLSKAFGGSGQLEA